MKKEELIKRNKKSHRDLHDLVDQLLERMDLEASITESWRLKDVLSHISWHEREMEKLISTMDFTGSEYWLLPNKERNQKIFQDCYDISAEEVLSEFTHSYNAMMNQLGKMPAEAMTDSTMFDKMPADWKPWQVFIGNMFEHYDDHINQIKRSTETLS